jgi:hypothetical protein
MPEYIFKGRMTLEGVTFFVEAENEEEAKFKASCGQYEYCEHDGASACDWSLHVSTCELNE